MLDPSRISFGAYHSYNRQMTNGSAVTANPETVEGMLESLGKTPPYQPLPSNNLLFLGLNLQTFIIWLVLSCMSSIF